MARFSFGATDAIALHQAIVLFGIKLTSNLEDRSMFSTARLLSAIAMGFVIAFTNLAQAQDIDSYFRRFNAAMDADQIAEAERYARLMLQVSPTEGWRAASLNSLGRACRALKKYDEAEKYYLQAIQIRLDASNVNNGWIPSNLGHLYVTKKRFSDAEKMFQRALTAFQRMQGENSAPVATVYNNFGVLYHDQEKYVEAEKFHRKAMEVRRNVFGSQSAQVADSLGAMADVSRHRERYDEAVTRYQESIAMLEKTVGPESAEVAFDLHGLGHVYRDAKKYESAETADRKSLQLYEKLYGQRHTKIVERLECLAEDLENLDRAAEAEPLRQRIAEIKAIAANPPKPKRLEVVAESPSIQDGAKNIASAKRGQQYDIIAVNGAWYGISITVAEQKKTGWLHDRSVKIIGYTEPTPLDLAKSWRKLSPPQSRLSVEFPGAPTANKQVVVGVDTFSFTHDTPEASYELTYFDMPSDRSLSFDAAMLAYAAKISGKVTNQKSIEKDFYPGRDFVIAMQNGSFDRVQLFNVNRRWIALEVKGNAASIYNDDASHFLSSFTLVD